MDKISVIVPCFNEEEVLPLFYKEVVHTLEKIQNIDYEILFINDGSQDHSEDILKLLAHKNKHCFYYSFSRNFGKEAAMYAGLENASGDYVVIMDADLQHPPYLLESMYQALKYEDYDCCAGKRIDRIGENKLRNFLSHSFYKVIQYIKNGMDGKKLSGFLKENRSLAGRAAERKQQVTPEPAGRPVRRARYALMSGLTAI